MTKPLVSVIVPVYGVEGYLNECVSSISNQTYKNLEVILVDDGSPDSSGRICDDFAKKDSRIKVIHKNNEGLNYARKTGFENSTGDYIAFIDSDDVVDKNYIKYLLNSSLKYNSDISICRFENFTQNIPKSSKKIDVTLYSSENIIESYLTSSPPHGNTLLQTAHMKLFSRKVVQNVDWRNSNYRIGEDEAMSAYLYSANTSKSIPIIKNKLYFYRQRPDSLTDILKKDHKNSFNGKPINRYNFLNNIKNLRLKLFSQIYEDAIYNWFSMNYIIYLQQVFGIKKHQPTTKELSFYNNDLNKIIKAHNKYKPWGIYKNIFNKIKKDNSINGFYDYMKENPLVSIIVPVYNSQEYIIECLDSLASQTYLNLEIILINDGSTDRSGKTCDDYARKDERIKVIHKDNEGVFIARNTGIKYSTGTYITFVDSDDFISNDGIEKLVNTSKKYNADITVADRIIYHTNGYEFVHSTSVIPSNTLINLKKASEDILYEFLANINIVGGKLYKKDLLVNEKILFPTNIKIGEDFEFLAKALIDAKNIVYIKEKVYYYRQDFSNNYSATGTIELDKSIDFGRALKNVHNYVKRNKINSKNLSNALRSDIIPQSLYALSIVEKDPEVHKKVFDYIHNDLFKYFKVSIKDVKNKNHIEKVKHIISNNYEAFLLNEILERRNNQQEMEYYIHQLTEQIETSENIREDLQNKLNFALSNKGILRIAGGKIKRLSKRVIPKKSIK